MRHFLTNNLVVISHDQLNIQWLTPVGVPKMCKLLCDLLRGPEQWILIKSLRNVNYIIMEAQRVIGLMRPM